MHGGGGGWVDIMGRDGLSLQLIDRGFWSGIVLSLI